jgi:hypothetical protein
LNFHYNVTGRERKSLANAVGEILTQPVVYSGPPTFAYMIQDIQIDRNGSLIFPPGTSRDYARLVVLALTERGFTADEPDIPEPEISNTIIEMPIDGFTDQSITNLEKLIASKAELIKKSLNVPVLSIEKTEHKLQFPWFNRELTPEEFTACAWFISALCNLAKSLKRVNSGDREVVNEKLTMRLFLIRLGFVGAKFKTARRILLRNLTGNSSWKSGQRPQREEDAP